MCAAITVTPIRPRKATVCATAPAIAPMTRRSTDETGTSRWARVRTVLSVSYVKKEFQLALGERTAEEIKIQMGSAFPLEDEMRAEIRGRDLVTGLPKTVVISTEQVREAIEEPVQAIVDAVKVTLDRTPPELAADIMEQGIVLTGGGALLAGLAQRLEMETNMPIIVADDPLNCVAIGSGMCLEDLAVFERMLKTSPSR